MQIFKGFILVLILSCTIPGICKASRSENLPPAEPATTIDSRAGDLFCSLMSLIHYKVGDFTEEVSHTTLDKKVFIKLFIYLRSGRTYDPADSRKASVLDAGFFPGPDGVEYYIYTLQKLLI